MHSPVSTSNWVAGICLSMLQEGKLRPFIFDAEGKLSETHNSRGLGGMLHDSTLGAQVAPEQ